MIACGKCGPKLASAPAPSRRWVTSPASRRCHLPGRASGITTFGSPVEFSFARFSSRAVAGRAVALAAVSCVVLTAPLSEARAQRLLNVVAHDTTLEAMPTVSAGLLTVRLVLKGKARRELVVHRVPVGTLPEDVVRGAAGRPERWFDKWSFGGPAVPRDSATDASVTMDLRPGRYVMVAYEVDAAGRPRGQRYLWRELDALQLSALIIGRFSTPDLRVRVKDASIEVVGATRPGQRTLQIENVGTRAHEIIVGRLKPGKTTTDAQRWNRDGAGEVPFVYIGGVTPMSSGITVQTQVVLQAGSYVVLCPGRGDRGAPDNARGVIATFRVS